MAYPAYPVFVGKASLSLSLEEEPLAASFGRHESSVPRGKTYVKRPARVQ